MKRNLVPEIGLTISIVIVQLLGVFALGWPAGNVLVLLWFENLLLTLMLIPRMVVFRGLPGGGWSQAMSTAAGSVFFCAVHLAFVACLALGWGIQVTWMALGLPGCLLVIRYVVEAVGRSRAEEPPKEFTQVYGFATSRIVMLHVAILICWGIFLGSIVLTVNRGMPIDLAVPWVVGVTALLVIKTGLEIYWTVRPRAVLHFSFRSGT